MSTISKINNRLKALQRTERLVRGRGYYYIPESLKPGLYVYTLGDDDLDMAVEFVEEALTVYCDKPFKLFNK